VIVLELPQRTWLLVDEGAELLDVRGVLLNDALRMAAISPRLERVEVLLDILDLGRSSSTTTSSSLLHVLVDGGGGGGG
jgi:hypothetical protein